MYTVVTVRVCIHEPMQFNGEQIDDDYVEKISR